MEEPGDAAGAVDRWTLHLPSGESRSLSGYPQSMREVVLLGMKYCDRVDTAMKDNVASIADPAALCAALPLTGISELGRVSLSSDEDLRCFFRAAGPEPALRLLISSEASSSKSERVISPRSFVAMREHSKAQESVQLNVGGSLREIHRMTAERIPLLAAMMRFPSSSSKPLFIDASPQAFDVLLEVARGRSAAYLEALEPSLRVLVREYAVYAGMEVLASERFTFRLSTVNPTNKSAVNTLAYLTQQGAACTTGVRPQWNTVVGDALVPQTGQSYWEVEVTSLGTAGREFMVGVVATNFTNMGSFMDSSNSGWGIYHNSAGAVFLRANGANQGNSYMEVFPIDTGTRIGVLVDADRGALLFFRNGIFKMSHMSSIKGQVLLPAISVYTDATLTVHTGLPVPT